MDLEKNAQTEPLYIIAYRSVLVGLGIFYGIGYCPFTDWHYRILYKLGHDELPYSYIQYAVERLTGLHPPAELTEIVTVAALCIALICSCCLNYRDWKVTQRDLE